MPTVLLVGQFRLYFWSREIERMHIHIRHKGLGIEASIWIDDMTVKRSSGSLMVDRAAIKLTKHFEKEVVEAWHSRFGNGGNNENV